MDNMEAVEKAFELIQYLADGREVNVNVATFALSVSSNNMSKIVQILVNKGFVVRDDQRQTLRGGFRIVINRPQMGVLTKITLPKGVDRITLNNLLQLFQCYPVDHEYTAEEVSRALGMSRVAVRNYLDFLVSDGMLRTDKYYGKIGRPNIKYRLRENHIHDSITRKIPCY